MTRKILRYCITCAVIIGLSFACGWICARHTAIVIGTSMNPTLSSNDIVYGSMTQQVRDNDIIVINDEYHWSNRNEYLIKRVVGKTGDRISIDANGRIHRNGTLISGENGYIEGCRLYPRGIAFTVPKGKLFLRGDNVNVSNDSRYTLCNTHRNYLVDASQIRIVEHGIIFNLAKLDIR